YSKRPGKNPASAAPSRKRTTVKVIVPVTRAVKPAMIPQLIMIRAIHSLAPTFSRITLGHLEYEITPEERAGRESEGSGGHVEISPHRQSGEAHVDPINVRQNVRQDRERQQAHVDLAHGRFFHCAVHLFLLCFHLSSMSCSFGIGTCSRQY